VIEQRLRVDGYDEALDLLRRAAAVYAQIRREAEDLRKDADSG